MFNVVLALIVVGVFTWTIIRLVLWRNEEYLSSEEQIQEMMDETFVPTETLWSLFDRLS